MRSSRRGRSVSLWWRAAATTVAISGVATAQYEALKKGYIDDVEFHLRDGLVQVRSSSRVGQTDFGVNAIRLNYISAQLRKEGWTADEITEKSFPDYFAAANDARDSAMGKGEDARAIQQLHPKVLSVSGPAAYEEVVGAVHESHGAALPAAVYCAVY